MARSTPARRGALSARLQRCPQPRRFFLLRGLHLDLFATSADALLLRRLVSLDSRRTLFVVASLRDVEARRCLRRLSSTTPSSTLHFLLLRHLSLPALFSLLSSSQPSFPSSPTVRRFLSLFSSPSQNRSVDKLSSLLPPFLLSHFSATCTPRSLRLSSDHVAALSQSAPHASHPEQPSSSSIHLGAVLPNHSPSLRNTADTRDDDDG